MRIILFITILDLIACSDYRIFLILNKIFKLFEKKLTVRFYTAWGYSGSEFFKDAIHPEPIPDEYYTAGPKINCINSYRQIPVSPVQIPNFSFNHLQTG